jgi:hypothetical protein
VSGKRGSEQHFGGCSGWFGNARRNVALTPFFLALPFSAFAYDINGVALGGSEAEVQKAFPSARCKPLEWKSQAADRRCDDARISLGGAEARITVFFKGGAVQAMDLRFNAKDLESVKATLRARWGAPQAEVTDVFAAKDRKERSVYKMRWAKGADRAVLSAPLDRKRATLEISRGSFPEEIYRVR